jgi:succinate dehydrogenase / fumarate reductase cytochrome b subunit
MAEIHNGQRAARPEYRNLSLGEILSYRMPPPAIVSILHRISGVLLFLVGIPFILYLFQNSLTSELSFENYRSAVSSWFGKLVLLALIWAFIHHLLAGIRFLLLDLHIAGEREQGANTARVVLGLSVLLTLVCALLLFGVL